VVANSNFKIKKSAFEFILGLSREVYPKEFTGLLRGNGNMITEILVIPATIYGDGFASIRLDMVPIDKSIIGSVHSHPGYSDKPSLADLRHFKKTGWIHLILRYPYSGINDITLYNNNGEKIELEVENEH